MAALVQTVTGPAPAASLGRTLVHEHLVTAMPGWDMDALAPPWDRAAAVRTAVETLRRLQDHGVETFVDPCPMDLGRDVRFAAEVADATGMRIVCTTGAYFEAAGITYVFRHLSVDDIAAIYEQELTDGIDGTGIRAGLIKVATGDGAISDYERKLLVAAGRAAVRCDVPVITHTENGTCGPEQLAVLTGEGVPAHRILVGHSDGSVDPAYHRSITDAGAYIGFDRLGLETIRPDEERVASIARLVAAGRARHVCLSHDVTCGANKGRFYVPGRAVPHERLLAKNPHWKPTNLFERIVPMLRAAGVSAADVETMLDRNPSRWFDGTERPGVGHA